MSNIVKSVKSLIKLKDKYNEFSEACITTVIVVTRGACTNTILLTLLAYVDVKLS